MRFCYRALACLTLVSVAFAAEPVSTVLVTDFQAPSGDTWNWARLGVAELAVEALNMHGIATVDRDLLTAVEAEHDLAAKQTQPDPLKSGYWLGATFMLGGEVEPLPGSHVRLSGTLTRVETAEQVGVFSVEGDYKSELQPLVDRLVAGLVKVAALDVQTLKSERVNPVKPEALLFFQQGVAACAAGKPALGIGFFRSASGIAPGFSAAREWEAQAYSLGGLHQHAAALRTRMDQQRRMTEQSGVAKGGEVSASQATKRVVSVLKPVVAKEVTLPQSAESLRHVVEQAVLDCGEMRLYRPEQLAESLTEVDRQLSHQFSRTGTSRYARWLSADFMIFTLVEPLAEGKISLTLDVRHSFSSRLVATVRRETSQEKLNVTLFSMMREWQTSAVRNAVPEATIPLVPLTDTDLQRLTEHRDIVQMLDIRMREPAKFTIEQHLALAASFSSQANPEVFKLETEEAMRKAESFEQHLSLASYFLIQGADDLLQRELERVTKKIETIAQRQRLTDILGEFKKTDQAVAEWKTAMDLIETSRLPAEKLYDAYLWASDFVWDPAVAQAVTMQDWERVMRIRARLLSEYPVTEEVFILRYMESYQAYTEENWAFCLTNAVAACDTLELLEKSRRDAKMAPPFSDERIALNLLRAPLLYQQFLSLMSLGDRAGARNALEKAIATGATGSCECGFYVYEDDRFIRKRVGVPFGLPANGRRPQDRSRWGKLTGRRYLNFDVKLKGHLARLDAEDAEKAKRGKHASLNEEMVKLLNEVNTSDREANARFVGYVCDVWNAMPPSTNALCPLADQAAIFLRKAGRVIPEGERLQRVDQLVRAYLRVTGTDADTLIACRETGWVASRLAKIMAFYLAAGFEEQGIKWVMPFLEESVDAALGAEILLVACGDISVDQRFRVWKGFVENHKAQEMGALPVKQYCERLMECARQAYSEDPEGWYNAVTLWQAYSTNFTVSVKQAEHFVPRVAVMSLPTDPLGEATRILQRMKLPSSMLTDRRTAWIHWYRAGAFHLDKGNYAQALSAFRCVWALCSWREYPEAWHTVFLEGKALAATGQPVEAVKRFRRLSKELGTRAFVIDDTYLPLGLMSAKESLKLHTPENEWAAREVEERELYRMRGLFETASQSKVQVEEGQRHYTSEGTKLVPNNTNAKRELLAYSMESGKPLNLSLDWTLSVCGTNPVDSEDLCLRAISLLQNGNAAEARKLMERAKKVNPEGCFVFNRTPYESCKMTHSQARSGPVVHFWLARACAGAGDINAAYEALVEGVLGFYWTDEVIVCLGKEYERLTGQRLAGNPQDALRYRLAVLRHYSEKEKDDSWWPHWRIAVEGLKGNVPVKDCLQFVALSLKATPEDIEFNLFKALLLLKDGKAEEAISFAREVTANNPDSAAGRYALGAALLEVGDTEGAVRELRLAYKGVENNWTRWFPRLHHHYHQLSIVSLLDALSLSRTLSGET